MTDNISPHSDLLNSASGTAIAVALPIETMPYLTDEQVAELAQLQSKVAGVEAQEATSITQRALLLRAQHRFIAKYGVSTLAHHAETNGFSYKPTKLAYSLPAQLVLNKNVAKASEATKDKMRNEVAQTARALAELDRLKGVHDHLTDDEFVGWYRKKGNITGLSKLYLGSQRGAATNASAQGTSVVLPEQVVEAMLGNLAAKEVEFLPGIDCGQLGLLLYRHEGATTRIVPLNLSLHAIAALSGYAPCPMASWPTDLRFWREVLIAGEGFVPDEMSNIPIEDVPEGDEANSTYEMLPANGVYLVERGVISIAYGRRDDGLIVEITPRADLELGFSLTGECFIDNLTRRRLTKRLRGQTDADLFARTASDGVAAPVTIKGKSKTLAFLAEGEKKPVNLIVKPREIGTIWTYRSILVPSEAIKADMIGDQVKAFTAGFMQLVVKKQKDRPVKLAIAKGKISFAIDKAAAVDFAATTQGAAKTEVMLSDFRRALVALLELPLVTGLAWHIAPEGMVMIEGSTDLATYKVSVQALEGNREQATRSRALRERVESLPKTDASVAETAAAAAA